VVDKPDFIDLNDPGESQLTGHKSPDAPSGHILIED
jgi:hypothetical protein